MTSKWAIEEAIKIENNKNVAILEKPYIKKT